MNFRCCMLFVLKICSALLLSVILLVCMSVELFTSTCRINNNFTSLNKSRTVKSINQSMVATSSIQKFNFIQGRKIQKKKKNRVWVGVGHFYFFIFIYFF